MKLKRLTITDFPFDLFISTDKQAKRIFVILVNIFEVIDNYESKLTMFKISTPSGTYAFCPIRNYCELSSLSTKNKSVQWKLNLDLGGNQFLFFTFAYE